MRRSALIPYSFGASNGLVLLTYKLIEFEAYQYFLELPGFVGSARDMEADQSS